MPRVAAVAALLALAAPAGAAPDLSPRDRGDLAVRARTILRKYCADCHGEKPRRGDVSVLDHAKLAAPAYPIPLVNPADPPRSVLLQLLRDGSMPPGGRTGPSGPEIQALADWIAAGAPGYPRAFGDRYAAEATHADWTAQPTGDKPFARYLSFAHLLRDDAPPPDLRTAEVKLRGALRAGTGKDAALAPVDPTATLFRLDLRNIGWDRGDLFDRVGKFGTKGDAHPLTALDVVMLEYPFAAAAAWPVEVGKLTPKLSGVRPVPVVRGDWLATALAANAPLTADVRALADLVPGKEPCGPLPGRFFASTAEAGRPLDAWDTADPPGGAFDFTAEVVTGPQFDTPTPDVKEGEKHKLRIKTDRRVSVKVLRVLARGNTSVQVLERDVLASGTTLLGPRANVPLSATVSGGGDAATDYYVLFAAETEAPLPVPTILKSRHRDDCEVPSRQPVWRFVFDATDPAFDPARVVRRVVPLTVRKQ